MPQAILVYHLVELLDRATNYDILHSWSMGIPKSNWHMIALKCPYLGVSQYSYSVPEQTHHNQINAECHKGHAKGRGVASKLDKLASYTAAELTLHAARSLTSPIEVTHM